MAKPQLRTYILTVGRSDVDAPVRFLSPYRVPIAGLTDDYETMSNPQLKQARAAMSRNIEQLQHALVDLEAEAYRRLEAIK